MNKLQIGIIIFVIILFGTVIVCFIKLEIESQIAMNKCKEETDGGCDYLYCLEEEESMGVGDYLIQRCILEKLEVTG